MTFLVFQEPERTALIGVSDLELFSGNCGVR